MKTTRSGFTLLEMLTAMAVLSLMMVFMFNIVAQTVRAWEAGSRRMESAQAARIGMNLLASELRYAFAGVATNTGTDGASVFTNFAPFLVTTNLPGETSGELSAVPGSQSLFFVSTCAPHDPQESFPFAEVGYMPVFVNDATGHIAMAGPRYYLVRHGATPGAMTDAYQDFYYRQGPTNNTWTTNASSSGNRTPIVDNCIRFSLQFASNNNGNIDWPDKWTSQTNLPLGVLITMLVLDNKSATRLEKIQGTTLLTADTIDKATNGATLASNDVAGRIVREGTTVIRRFVPLVNSYYSP